MELGAHETVPGLKRGTQFEGDVRLDPSPCWRRDVKALAVPGIAPDGTRQTFVIHLEDFAEAREARAKPRVIVTTDGEGDDQCSMVRFLLYANEWDLQGIVFSSSKHHWLGDGATPGYKWLGMEWLDEQLAAYAEVYPNLTLHDAGYPTPDYVKSQVYVGNILLEGDMREPTPGSDHIARVLLQPETSPVWLQAWGGLKTIQEEHPERMAEVARKARIFLVAQQDSTFQDYIQKEWPGITTLGSTYDSYGAISYRWHEFQSPEILPYFEPEWLLPNILQGHGPLGARYILKKGKYRSEGDSVAFLHLIDTGLRSAENPACGGWGGRFAIEEGAYWKSADKQGMPPHSILRWAIDFQNDWAARADWCVKPFEDANHPPEVVLDHSADLFAAPGERVTLRATNTRDPDGNALQFRWWQHVEAGTHAGPVEIQEPNRPECQVLMPSDVAPGDTIHLICAVTDDGTPPLSRYARVIITGANSTQE
ncbi:MAG: DUF1593 domain-containing protein [Candidatus Hydrogenedentes bacterium]|nr:DUF1593 domain-containing protein [Candidatus Hydrogenedentota bacterium]